MKTMCTLVGVRTALSSGEAADTRPTKVAIGVKTSGHNHHMVSMARLGERYCRNPNLPKKVRGMEWRPVLVAAHVTFALWVFTRSRNARRFCNKVVQHQAFWEV